MSLELRSLSEIRTNPYEKPEPLIDGLLNRGELVIVTGQWDSFKSRFTAEFARAIVTGEKFLGHFPVQSSAPVFIIQKEINPAFYDERMIGLMRGTPDDTKFYVSYEDFRFNNGYGIELGNIIKFHGIRLIIFDPLTYFWPDERSFDENSSGDVSNAISPILKLRATGCSFIFVHHDPKPSINGGGIARGSSVLVNAPDARILLHRQGDEDSVTVRCRTRNIKPPPKFKADLVGDRLIYSGEDKQKQEILFWLSEKKSQRWIADKLGISQAQVSRVK